MKIVIKLNETNTTAACGGCGGAGEARQGPCLFIEGTQTPVCERCARAFVPELVALLNLMRAAALFHELNVSQNSPF